jgi:hypothetical protein
MTHTTRTGGFVRKKNGDMDMRYSSSRQFSAWYNALRDKHLDTAKESGWLKSEFDKMLGA